jgi:hypothetical protein
VAIALFVIAHIKLLLLLLLLFVLLPPQPASMAAMANVLPSLLDFFSSVIAAVSKEHDVTEAGFSHILCQICMRELPEEGKAGERGEETYSRKRETRCAPRVLGVSEGRRNSTRISPTPSFIHLFPTESVV